MASLSTPDFTSWRAPQGMHLALALTIPGCFGTLVMFWLTGSGPNWPEFPVALGYSLALGIWAPWRRWTHQALSLKVWFWLVLTGGLYALFAWIDGVPWPRTFGPEGRHVFWFSGAFVQGQITAFWTGQLASRARLFLVIEGIPSGHSLEERIRDFQVDADFSRANEAALNTSLAVMSVVVALLAATSPYGFGGLSMVLAGAFFFLCLLTAVLFRVYRREVDALIYGRRLTVTEKLAPLGWSALLACLASLAAWGLVTWGPPPIDWNQILSLQTVTKPPVPEPKPLKPVWEIPQAGTMKWTVLVALLSQIFGFGRLVALIELVVQLAIWAAPVALVAFLLWPVGRWILSGGRETQGFWSQWKQRIAEQWKAFLALWRGLPRTSRPESEGALAREWIRSLFQRPVAGGRVPYPEVVEAFLAVVRWAEPLAPYQRGQTTHEYLDRLAPLIPERWDLLVEIRDQVDEELFGAQGLAPSARRRLKVQVAQLIASPAIQDRDPGVS